MWGDPPTAIPHTAASRATFNEWCDDLLSYVLRKFLLKNSHSIFRRQIQDMVNLIHDLITRVMNTFVDISQRLRTQTNSFSNVEFRDDFVEKDNNNLEILGKVVTFVVNL